LGIAAAVALAFGIGLSSVAAQDRPGPTLAVLPFTNSSGDAAQDFFAGGMTDEIAAVLSRVRGLGVVARSSSFQLKPSDRTVEAAGKALNAAYIVQGTVRLSADRAQLGVRLLRASDGARLWSEDFDARLNDIFDVEDSIARKIAGALQVAVGGETLLPSRTRDVAAYLDFLRAKVAARPRGAAALGNAVGILEQVVTREPDFAPASALLAYAYALTPLFAPSLRAGMPEEERKIVERTVPRGDALARRANASLRGTVRSTILRSSSGMPARSDGANNGVSA